MKFLRPFAQSLILSVPKWVKKCVIRKNELTVYVEPKTVLPFFAYLKNHTNTQFKLLMDITAVDYQSTHYAKSVHEEQKRFEVVYLLLSLQFNTRIRVKTWLDELTPVDSLVSLYPSASWPERETWDMFGIFFFEPPRP
jgi:NADH dehydrogenase (ubiquinone) Fe-S protein 3